MIKKSYFDIDYRNLSVSQILEQIDDYTSAGADVHEINQSKQNILMQMTHFLKEHSEQLISKFILLGADLYFKNEHGDFPLRSCARSGTVQMFKAFLEGGFDLKKLTPEEKEDVSVAATYNNNSEMLKFVVDLGLYDYSAHKKTILNQAILYNNDHVVQAMLEAKVDLKNQRFLDDAVFTMNKLDEDDFDLMQINRKIIKSLIQAGAKLSDEKDAVFRAISNYHIAVHTIKNLNEIGVNWKILTPTEQKEIEKIF